MWVGQAALGSSVTQVAGSWTCDNCTYLHEGEQVLNLLTQVHTEYGKTVIMITHNPESMRIADRVIELRDGKIESTTVPGS